MKKKLFLYLTALTFIIGNAQNNSEGPFEQLIIRGITLINGNGAPPRGPIDLVIEKDKIVKIVTVCLLYTSDAADE